MQWRLQFETVNDAFTASPSAEIARILRETADRVEALQDSGITEGEQPVYDLNGNLVGSFDFMRRIGPETQLARGFPEKVTPGGETVPA